MNLNTNQKVATVVGIAAVGAVLAAYFWKTRKDANEAEVVVEKPAKKKEKREKKGDDKKERNEGIEKNQTVEKATETPIQESQPSDPKQIANELKDLGNNAFKRGNYDEAVRYYTEALQHVVESDAHFYYSNRAAAYLASNNLEKSKGDAETCIRLKPDWSKGYFRLGKALLAGEDFEQAFSSFYAGLLREPNNEELKKLKEITREKIQAIPCELEPRTNIDTKMIHLHFERQSERLCEEALHVPYSEIKKVVTQAAKDDTVSSLLDNELISKCHKEHAPETLLVLVEILLSLNKIEDSRKYALDAYKAAPTNPQVLIMFINTLLRQKNADFMEALSLAREALKQDPQNVLVIHTYASILLRLHEIVGTPQCPVPVHTLLEELKVGLENPRANHLLVADCGIRIWFKLFEDPAIQQQLIQEEQENRDANLPINQAYIKGLTHGAFSKLCLVPIFTKALSQVAFNNPGLEKVLGPFRTAFATVELGEDFEFLTPLIHAVALQCFRNNYLWPNTEEDVTLIDGLKHQLDELIDNNPPEELIKEGRFHPQLYHRLSLLSLFLPLSELPKLRQFMTDHSTKIDFAKTHPWFAAIVKKSLLDAIEESGIEVPQIGQIVEDDMAQFYEDHLSSTWDSAGLTAGRMEKVPLPQELEWIFPHHKFSGFDNTRNTRLLIAGCGTGNEAYQSHIVYENVDITGIDVSRRSLAYAVRQNRELGVEAKFFQADILSLEANSFAEPFDCIIANNVLHYFDDIDPWEHLVSLLRPGGVLRVSVYMETFLEILAYTRKFLNRMMPVPLFDNAEPVPNVKRQPTLDELRDARTILLDSEDKNLEPLLMTPSFYTLNEFKDLVFHPRVTAFSFTKIGKYLKSLGLNLVGFEFPGLQQEVVLSYRVEHPHDKWLKDFESLQEFSTKHNIPFQNFFNTVTFTCEKPIH